MVIFQVLRNEVKKFTSGDSHIGASLNIMNSIIGAGVLFLPYTFYDLGVVLGIVFLMVGVFLITFGHFMTFFSVSAARIKHGIKREKLKKIEDAVLVGFDGLHGVIFYWIMKISILIYSIGITLSYAIVLNKSIQSVIFGITEWEILDEENFSGRVILGLIITTLLLLMSTASKAKHLRIVSLLAVTSMWIFFVLVIIFFFSGISSKYCVGELRYFPKEGFRDYRTYIKMFKYGGIYTFSSLTPQVAITIGEWKNEVLPLLRISIYNAYVFSFIIYGTVSMIGYFSFLDNTRENFVLSYSGGAWITVLLRSVIIFEVFMTYPIWNFVLATSVEEIIIKITNAFKKKEKKEEEEKEEEISKKKSFFKSRKFLYGLLSIFCVIMIGITAVIYPKSSVVAGYAGGLNGVVLIAAPPCLYLRYCAKGWVSKVVVGIYLVVATSFLGVCPLVLNILEEFGVIKSS